MLVTTHILHNAVVKNNCPLCYSTAGLDLEFSQEEVENKFYSKAKKDIKEVLTCSNCKQQIFPVNWTEDIERVYQYNRKLVTPKSSGVKLKPLLYMLLIFDAILIAAVLYYLKS